jgi:peptide/nickel transport system substrate-binding protein
MSEFMVLGPLGARGAAGEVRLGGGATVRIVLAILVLRAGQPVSRDALVDALWPEDPPPSARQTVESYVSRLRRALREAGLGGAEIDSEAAGYRLALNGYSVDRDEFERLAADGRDARSRGDAATAAARFGEALALWRGPALDGLADRPALRSDAAALDQARLLVLEAWVEAQLDLGNAAEVVAALHPEASRYPHRERLHELLMLALYRCGSQAEALEHYAAVRRRLVDELGIEPGPALRDMQERILRQDPRLDREPRKAPAAAPPPTRQSEAPRSRWRLTGAVAAGAVLAGVGVVAVVSRGGDRAGPAALPRGPAFVAIGAHDALTGSALTRVAAGITAGLGARWVTAPDDGTVIRVNRDGVATQTVGVGHGPAGVVTTRGDVWVAVARDGQVVRVDGPSNRVVQRIPVGASPSVLAASGGTVWVADGREPTLTRIDARTGEVLGTTTLRGHAGGLAVGFGAVWATLPTVGRLARLDPRTGRVLDEIPVGSGPGPIAVGGDGVWVANALDSTVSLIDPDRAAVVLTQQVRGTATAMAAIGRRVWVAAADAPALTRLTRGEPARVLALPSAATALAADRGTLLAALGPDRASHRGGTLRVETSGWLADVDTRVCCNAPPALRNASYDALLGISVAPGAVGALVPNLALTVPRPQDGGRTYTFRLRPDLRYWTGRRVRASDFRRGLELAVGSSRTLGGYVRALPGIDGCSGSERCDLRAAVQTDDDAGTVTVHLRRPDPEFLWAMALSFFAPAPLDRGPVPGTGPYRIARLVPKRLVELRRNPYFRERAPAAQPDGYPDRILWKMGRKPERPVADVLAGRADYTDDGPSRTQLETLRVRSPGQLHANPVAGDEFAWLNTRARPFDDVRVRRALAFAVDRGAIARRWGPGARPLCQVVPSSIPGHVQYCPYTRRPNKAGIWNAPDLDQARALIAASGTKGMAITYWAKTDTVGKPGLVDSYMASLLRGLGYKVTLRAIRPNTERNENTQIGTGSWWADIPSPSQWTQLLSCTALDSSQPRFCDPTVDRWARRAERLQRTNPAAAGRLWARVDRRITDQAPWIPAIQPAWVSVLAARVGGYQYVPTIGVLLHRLWVR